MRHERLQAGVGSRGWGCQVESEGLHRRRIEATHATSTAPSRRWRMISIASSGVSLYVYMRYAATIVTERPAHRQRGLDHINGEGDALMPATQCTSTPRPLSSSDWMKEMEGRKCVRMSDCSSSSRRIWCRRNVCAPSHQHFRSRRVRDLRTSFMRTRPRIAVSTL